MNLNIKMVVGIFGFGPFDARMGGVPARLDEQANESRLTMLDVFAEKRVENVILQDYLRWGFMDGKTDGLWAANVNVYTAMHNPFGVARYAYLKNATGIVIDDECSGRISSGLANFINIFNTNGCRVFENKIDDRMADDFLKWHPDSEFDAEDFACHRVYNNHEIMPVVRGYWQVAHAVLTEFGWNITERDIRAGLVWEWI